MIAQISLAALFAAIILMLQHYLPWQLIIRRKLPRVAAYILGVSALGLPLTCLYGYWTQHPPADLWYFAIALWAVIVSGGLTVMGAYLMDFLLRKVALAHELAELLDLKDRGNGAGE